MISNIIVSFLYFIVFAYVEHGFKMGCAVSFIFGIYAFLNNAWILSLLSVLQMGLHFADESVKGFSILSFLIQIVILFFGFETLDGDADIQDDHVKFRPHEEEIRQYLFRVNPSILHTVDSLLNSHRGREGQLFEKIKKDYPENSASTRPRKIAQKRSDDDLLARNQIHDIFRFTCFQLLMNVDWNSLDCFVFPLRLYDRNRISTIDALLQNWAGHEDELLFQLREEYGITPNPSPVSQLPRRGSSRSQEDQEIVEDAVYQARVATNRRMGYL